MPFYCSEKFRLNANGQQVDIWLIYKCAKCDTTWKLTLFRGIRPDSLPAELFYKLTNNDAALARQYAFDRQLQAGCDVDYSGVEYKVEGLGTPYLNTPLDIRITSEYYFDLKLSVLLAQILRKSVNNVRKLADAGLITTSLDCNVMKYRIRADLDVTVLG